MNEDNLSFKGNDPGAVRYGNFINYYQFHPPATRIDNLPDHLWTQSGEHCAVLDIGCNSGDLTIELHNFLQKKSQWKQVSTLGIDIDDLLITRAKELSNESISFQCIDIMSNSAYEKILMHLDGIGKKRFDIVFCFSITMWIHLNHGDDGLKRFLKSLCDICEMIVIEPQPWKCYRTAVRRMKKSSESFPLYSLLKIRSNVETDIENIIIEDGRFQKLFESVSANWDRKILFFQNMKKDDNK
ncbi:putative RNA methyltransferase CG11342 [Arctopsyche grandis]|uniref:putative RNA methyltransferase CG11342 n=1 Tax=Arctopsyche grandis TaxID=121162 RepID=UPI00406DA093